MYVLCRKDNVVHPFPKHTRGELHLHIITYALSSFPTSNYYRVSQK
jgi:hypothetical protein